MLCPHGLPGEGAPAAPRAVPSPPAGPPSEHPPPPSAPAGRLSEGPPAASATVPTEPPRPARGGPYIPPPLPAAPAGSAPSLLDPGTERDPYPLYRTLRGRFPLLYDEPFGAWLISRYADVRAALADPRLAAPEPGPALAHLDTGAPDAHRALVSPAFQDGAPAALAAGVERAAYVLARRLADREDVDLVAEFCQWLPTAAVVSALGLPYEATARVHSLCRAGLDHLGGHHPALADLLGPHIARRRAHPGDDLLSLLCTARTDGRPLTDEAVTGVAGVLLGAGGGTTARALATFLANLLDHPGQLDAIRDRPELADGAWAESLRRDPPLHVVPRRALETIGPIPAGATVACLLGAAGRDPRRFADPDRYDAFRADPGTLAYGSGRHFCPGTSLARLTAVHGLRALLDVLPHLRRVPGDRPPAEGLVSRSPRTLPVRLRRPAPAAPRETARRGPPRVRGR
ncbi:cytochrome P450 [Streptomyces sp. NPDC001422]|uniref:cytochrome P450 n=1 Tax=unclassified Streptomyces TaxID=2593676 RepID=UPI0036C715FD